MGVASTNPHIGVKPVLPCFGWMGHAHLYNYKLLATLNCCIQARQFPLSFYTQLHVQCAVSEVVIIFMSLESHSNHTFTPSSPLSPGPPLSIPSLSHYSY